MKKQIFDTKDDLDLYIKTLDYGNNIKLSSCEFNFDVEFAHKDRIELIDCTFFGTFKLAGTISSSSTFKDVIFNQKSDFSNCKFERNTRFHNCTFKEIVNFDNTKFLLLADFWSSTFFKPVIFYKTDFHGKTVFSAATFKENVLFTYSLIENQLILRRTNFNKGVDLSLSLLSGEVNLFGIILSNYNSVQDEDIEEIYNENVSKKGLIHHKNKRETFRILKKQLISQGNMIDALSMAAKEKLAYQSQLNSEKKLKKGKWYRRMQDQFILGLGQLSNSHGESWTRGVGFTLLVGLFFFYLSIISTEDFFFTLDVFEINFNETSKYYFQFLLPTHDFNFLVDFEPSWSTYLFDLFGRIFVSFGVYQTIVAFRKYHYK